MNATLKNDVHFKFLYLIPVLYFLTITMIVTEAADPTTNAINANNTATENENKNQNMMADNSKKSDRQQNHSGKALPFECGTYWSTPNSIHKRRRGKIIGGNDAAIEEFPWHASLQKLRILLPLPIPDWRHVCGASIINEEWLITAAHCVDGLLNAWWPGQLRVVLGTDRWRYTLLQQNLQLIPVAKIIVHPEWNSRRALNDIALIKTNKPIKFNSRVQPICLPDNEQYDMIGGQIVTVAGYGYTTDNLVFNFLPDRLKSVQVPVVRMDQCRALYNVSRILITDRMLCAGITTYGRCSGAMRGDSGSALISYQNSRAIHTGIVSFSLPCRMFGAPDVYTRTAAYLSWIRAMIQKN